MVVSSLKAESDTTICFNHLEGLNFKPAINGNPVYRVSHPSSFRKMSRIPSGATKRSTNRKNRNP